MLTDIPNYLLLSTNYLLLTTFYFLSTAHLLSEPLHLALLTIQAANVSQANLLDSIRKLEETGVVLEAHVFGSTSPKSAKPIPNDLDVILVLPEDKYREFINELPTEIEDGRVLNVYGNPRVATYRMDVCRRMFHNIA